MNTSTGEIYKFLENDTIERENGKKEKVDLPKANFMKKIPDKYLSELQGMNRKQRRDFYKKHKKDFV